MKLIDKDILAEEIDNRIKKYTLLQQKSEMSDLQEELQNKIDCLNSIKGYILNTIKVKEVNLEKAIDDYIYTHNDRKRLALELDWKCCNLTLKGGDEIIKFAKHFFELGFKAQKGE